MTKIISYSLWGDNPKYTVGAVINAYQAREIYPDWQARFYCAPSVPKKIISQLQEAQAEVFISPECDGVYGPFVRFFALDDDGVERVIFRDTDSRLTQREAVAVQEWINSTLAGHIMRDHPCHAMVMLSGMWGCMGGVLPNMKQASQNFTPNDAYLEDQLFLARLIYPLLRKQGVLIHDDFFAYEQDARPFTSARKEYDFIGEIFDANGQRGPEWQQLQQVETLRAQRLRFKFHRFRRKMRERIWGYNGFI